MLQSCLVAVCANQSFGLFKQKFVYFGCVPVASDSPEAKILVPYVRKVLDTIGIKNGPSHGEVIMTKDVSSTSHHVTDFHSFREY